MRYILTILLLLVYPLSGSDALRNSMSSIINSAFNSHANKDHMIALASKNKMLSQRMAKDAILIVLNENKEESYKDLLYCADSFDALIHGLYHGDKNLKIVKAKDKKVLAHLGEVNAVWKEFFLHTKNFISNGKINKKSYQYIMANNEKLLRLSHKLMQTLKSKQTISTTFNKIEAHTLKILDRQRMLTQKILKEKLLLLAGIDTKRNEVRLIGSITLLENGLKALLNGENKRGVVQSADKKIQVKLKEAWSEWNRVEAIYRKDEVSKKELNQLYTSDPILLNVSVELVSLVEKSLGI